MFQHKFFTINQITVEIFLIGILGEELKKCKWQGQAMVGNQKIDLLPDYHHPTLN